MERMGCRLLHMPKEAEYGTLHTMKTVAFAGMPYQQKNKEEEL